MKTILSQTPRELFGLLPTNGCCYRGKKVAMAALNGGLFDVKTAACWPTVGTVCPVTMCVLTRISRVFWAGEAAESSTAQTCRSDSPGAELHLNCKFRPPFSMNASWSQNSFTRLGSHGDWCANSHPAFLLQHPNSVKYECRHRFSANLWWGEDKFITFLCKFISHRAQPARCKAVHLSVNCHC